MGIMPLIFAPPSLSHAYADKTVQIQVRSLTVGLFFLSSFVYLCVLVLTVKLFFFLERLHRWQQPKLQLFSRSARRGL